ncbi:hypothetical protein [Nocardiopsis halotolerans]|uniref:hypothetical protein n=1 Tax=Nocardiopsis halotolerans TaxID=124252 RepID=UPI000377C1D4|nr:hypothetical protein [Nocardiopsis halotolerans]
MYSHERTDGHEGTGGHMAATARDAAGGVASTAGDQARSLAHEARSEARHVTGDVQSRLREEAQEQTRRTSRNLRQWSEELSSMADAGDQRSPVSGAVRQVAQGGRGAADFLDERGMDGLVEETRRFARRRPLAFLAGAAVAGFAVGRVLRASSALSGQGQGDGDHPEAIGSGERARPPEPRLSEDDPDEVGPNRERPVTPRAEDISPRSEGPGRPGPTL